MLRKRSACWVGSRLCRAFVPDGGLSPGDMLGRRFWGAGLLLWVSAACWLGSVRRVSAVRS